MIIVTFPTVSPAERCRCFASKYLKMLFEILFEAEANDPIKARLILLVDYNGESPTINTDILGYVSMDDGANWEQVTLADQGLYDTDKHILAGEVSLTARTDKTMVVKFVTANGVDVYLEAWAPFWEY